MSINPGLIRNDELRAARVRESKRSERQAIFAAWLVMVCVVFLLLSGCASTVTPERVDAAYASFDGAQQNSGVITSTPTGYVVTAHFRERYNALIATYAGEFNPPLKPDAGIAPIGEDRWLIDKQHMVYFLTMNALRRARLEPLK
jgi:hypothetical protein